MIAKAVFQDIIESNSAILDERRNEITKYTVAVQHRLAKSLAAIRASGSLEEILECERMALQDEGERMATSAPMSGSLSAALEDLAHALAMIPRVRDPERYAEVAATHRNRHRQIGGLPRDDARVFFSSHAARLLNVTKAPLPHPTQAVLSERRLNMSAAEKMYKDLQLQALGLSGA